MSRQQEGPSGRRQGFHGSLGASSRSVDQPALVGREKEQRVFGELLGGILDGNGALALVSGEAGIGKTTLVEDLLVRAVDCDALVLTGGCYDLTTTPPYGPWVEILATYPADERLPSLPDQLRVGGGMAGIDSQAALFELAGRFLSGVARAQPLVILLEDLHWADLASLDLLRYLSRTLTGAPVLLIGTYRDDEIIREHPLASLLPVMVREGRVQRLELQRLGRGAVKAIVGQRYRLDHDDEARLLGYLDDRAEGNPFFVHELLHALEGQRLLCPTASGWHLDDLSDTSVPTLVQQVIDGRLARLDPATRELLDLVSVIGCDAPLDLILEIRGDATAGFDSALQQASDHQLLFMSVGRRTVRFSHSLVRQVIYEDIPFLRRQALHRGTGEALAGRDRPNPAVISNHFFEAGDERSLEWLERSAERAQSLFAPMSVINHADRGINLAVRRSFKVPLGLYRLRGLARESIGDFDGARADHELIVEQARERGDRRSEWQSLLDLGALWAFQDYDNTREYCERAVELARSMDDPDALGHSLNRLGNWHINVEQPTEALRHQHEALELFERGGNRHGLATTLDLVATTHWMAGDLANSVETYERAIPLLRLENDRKTLSSSLANAAGAAMGDTGRAVRLPSVATVQEVGINDLLDEAIQLARDIDWRSGEVFALGRRGAVRLRSGALRAGLHDLAASMSIAKDIHHLLWQCHVHYWIGVAYVDLQLPDRAEGHLKQMLKIAEAMDSSFFLSAGTGFLASAYVQSERLGEAENLLRERVKPDRKPGMFSQCNCWIAYADLALAQDDPDTALAIVDELITSLPSTSGSLSPDLLRVRGEILLACGRLEDANTDLAEASVVSKRLVYPVMLWRILSSQRKLYLAQGRVKEAHEAADAALGIVHDLANQLDNEDLRSQFLTNARSQIPGAAPYRPDRSTSLNYAGLTPREIEVLQAIADGLTDAEAGERLFIATRTVSQHLRSVYNKLGVNNRAAAVRIAVEQGLV